MLQTQRIMLVNYNAGTAGGRDNGRVIGRRIAIDGNAVKAAIDGFLKQGIE